MSERKAMIAVLTGCLIFALLVHLMPAAPEQYGLWKMTSGQVEEADTEKYVALTFDDGPNARYTIKLLDGLKERGVKASFFLLGENIEGNEAIVKRIQEDGHLIGNHTYRHIQLTTASEKMVCDYVDSTNQMIEEITGQKPEYLRPPYGDWNENLDCLFPMTKVLWTVDSRDWQYQNRNRIVKHVLADAEDGDIILMHDIFQTSVEAALEIVDRMQEEGYRFVTVDEMLIE